MIDLQNLNIIINKTIMAIDSKKHSDGVEELMCDHLEQLFGMQRKALCFDDGEFEDDDCDDGEDELMQLIGMIEKVGRNTDSVEEVTDWWKLKPGDIVSISGRGGYVVTKVHTGHGPANTGFDVAISPGTDGTHFLVSPDVDEWEFISRPVTASSDSEVCMCPHCLSKG